MSNKINHTGTIISINDHMVHVNINQSSACSSCKVAGHCNAAESKDKTIDISVPDPAIYHVGERVNVSTSGKVGMMAVVYAYVIPFVLMLGVLVVTLSITGNEIRAALMSIFALLPYYIVVYLLSSKIQQQVAFQIDSAE